MCYSAMVKQDVKKLGMQFHARVQLDMLEEIFARRLAGEKLAINKVMELPFLHGESPEDKAISAKISAWHTQQMPEIAQAGHDRTPIYLKAYAVDACLCAKGTTVKELEPILNRRERPKYSHRVMGAA